MTERYDLAVVGAGPAGGLAALLAARRGASVLLVEKACFPRAKVCGGCLNAAGLAVLHRAGFAEHDRRPPMRPLNRLRLAAGHREAVLNLAGGAAVSRAALDHALATAAVAEGAVFQDQTTATLEPFDPADRPHRPLQLRSRGQAPRRVLAAVVIVADGLAGTALGAAEPWRIARGARFGFGAIAPAPAAADYAPGVIHMACGQGGYVGLVRLPDGQLDIAAAADPACVRAAGGPGRCAAQWLEAARWPAITDLETLPWRGTPALTRTRPAVAGPRVLVVGDATGYVEPFTGEGIGWALRGAEAAVPLALEGIARWTPALGRRWTREHRRLFAGRRLRCRIITGLLRRPRLLAAATAMLRYRPELAGPLTRRLAAGS